MRQRAGESSERCVDTDDSEARQDGGLDGGAIAE
jgi:hypothetical protein